MNVHSPPYELRAALILLFTCLLPGCDRLELGEGECRTGFNDLEAIGNIVEAFPTFAYPAGRDATGAVEPCDERIHTSCWTYRERCEENWIRVDPLTHGHFHLVPDDPDIQGRICGGEVGFFLQGDESCRPVDPATITRSLMTHTQEHWIKIWMEDGATGEARPFDLRAVSVEADKPIQLWVLLEDGTWLCWNPLDHSRSWQLGTWANNIVEARIRGANSGPGQYRIGGFGFAERSD